MTPNRELDPEDHKLVTLARAARARTDAAEGAAIRDETGRTYAATAVTLPSLALSALETAVAMAVSSGAAGLEAAALVTEADTVVDTDLAVLREVRAPVGVRVIRADPTGAVRSVDALA